ncbi:MAG: hypothetical protein HY685_05075 [Chloroflexi bacterium]|nr:hypothetical protein [Chloroflexota bacterium]
MGTTAEGSRRKFLKQATFLLGGIAAGVALLTREAQAKVPAPPDSPREATPLRLYGQHWHLYSQARKKGELPLKGDNGAMYGELVDEPGGKKMGEFYSHCLFLQAPFGPGPFAAAAVEVHTFNLEDGTILGMGAMSSPHSRPSVYTLVGGTGRYAGARGTYTARQDPQELGGDGTADIVFSLQY